MQAVEIDPHIKEKGDKECVTWDFLHAFIMQQQKDDLGLIITTLAIYELFIFPKALGYIDGRMIGLFHQVMHEVNPIPAILAESFWSLNYCQTKGYTGLAGGLTRALAPKIKELIDYNRMKLRNDMASSRFSVVDRLPKSRMDRLPVYKKSSAFLLEGLPERESSLSLFHVHQRKLVHLFIHQASACPDDRRKRFLLRPQVSQLLLFLPYSISGIPSLISYAREPGGGATIESAFPNSNPVDVLSACWLVVKGTDNLGLEAPGEHHLSIVKIPEVS
ncbi:hypothetical protein Ancab_037826 [Ancistrocladus abbreviatus]